MCCSHAMISRASDESALAGQSFAGMQRRLSTWLSALSLLLLAAVKDGFTQTCPPDATATAVALTVTALRTNGQPIGAGMVQVGEPYIVRMALVYIPIDPITGGKSAAFENGRMLLTIRGSSTTDVTPPGGIPLIGGNGTEGCNGTNFVVSLSVTNTTTFTDAETGTILISGVYTNGDARLGDPPLMGVVSGSQAFSISVNQACVICLSRGLPGIFDDAVLGDSRNTQSGPCGTSFGSNTKWFTMQSLDTGLATLSARGCSQFALFTRQLPLTSVAPTTANCTSLSTNELRYQFWAQRSFYYWVAVRITNTCLFRLTFGFEPKIERIILTDSRAELSSSVAPNLPYSLEATSILGSHSNSWSTLDTEVIRSGQRLYFFDSTAREARQRFYRIVPKP